MTDRATIDTVAADCERYWRAAGIKRRIAAEMRAELEQHLTEASTDGRTPESVVGTDTATFAIEWAEDDHVLMTGPVAVSFTGSLDPTLLHQGVDSQMVTALVWRGWFRTRSEGAGHA